jgi:ribA/ribD-fused uncharacterized protein
VKSSKKPTRRPKVAPVVTVAVTLPPLPFPNVPDIIGAFQGNFRFLSNFFPCTVHYGGEEYPTAEHAYQAAKTPDRRWRERIRKAPTPGNAKAYGRTVPLREDWEEIKVAVMFGVLFHKFVANPPLMRRLLATAPAYLEEGTLWHDRFWGVCTCTQCHGMGKNVLGKLLMHVRDQLQDL